MEGRHADKPQVEWQVGDVRDMSAIASKSVDVAFDKGTLDAMIHGSPWSPPEEVLENSGRYMSEVCGDASTRFRSRERWRGTKERGLIVTTGSKSAERRWRVSVRYLPTTAFHQADSESK
jgi:hypothetical protein